LVRKKLRSTTAGVSKTAGARLSGSCGASATSSKSMAVMAGIRFRSVYRFPTFDFRSDFFWRLHGGSSGERRGTLDLNYKNTIVMGIGFCACPGHSNTTLSREGSNVGECRRTAGFEKPVCAAMSRKEILPSRVRCRLRRCRLALGKFQDMTGT
jgi:hypothetical protein